MRLRSEAGDGDRRAMDEQREDGVIVQVVAQHADELANLWVTRRVLAEAGHVGLTQLWDLDERIAAHFDGCVVGGACALEILGMQLNAPDPSKVFACAAVALECRDRTAFEHAVSVAEAMPECVAGLASALGWVSSTRLVGLVQSLLRADSVVRRRLGLVACRMHAVDPGSALAGALGDEESGLVIEALRVATALGKLDALRSAQKVVSDGDDGAAAVAAEAAVLLGNRGSGLEALTVTAMTAGVHRRRAFRVALQAMGPTVAHGVLKSLAADPQELCWLLQGSGIAGDPAYVPWLFNHMPHEKSARLAGEAFTLITGADLTALKLDRPQPEGFEGGPNDDPDDPNVDMDPDDGLPWPDVQKVENWWAANAGRFQKGTRYFMGAPVTREHCLDVLKHGYQRQRILAAHYLCLLNPGTPLFNTSAPAWRQQRLLAKM